MPRRGELREVAIVVAVPVLVGLVAVAAGAGAPTVPSAPGSQRAQEVLGSVIAIALAVAGLVVVAMLRPMPPARRDGEEAKRSRFVQACSMLAWMVAILLIAWLFTKVRSLPPFSGEEAGSSAAGSEEAAAPGSGQLPAVVWATLAVGATLAAITGLIVLAQRRSLAHPSVAEEPAGVADALDERLAALADALGDADAEGDPRRAVILAYASFEQAAADLGHPRRPSETSSRYLRRTLVDVGLPVADAETLGRLYEWARYSGHPVTESMRQEALAAVASLRAELRVPGGGAAVTRRGLLALWLVVAAVYAVPLLFGATDVILGGRVFLVITAAVVAWWFLQPAMASWWPPRPSRFDEVAAPPVAAAALRPPKLVEVEQTIARAERRAGEVHLRLRPMARRIAGERWARLEGRGPTEGSGLADLDALDDADGVAAVGPAAWSVIRADRPEPNDPRARGLSGAELLAVVDGLTAMAVPRRRPEIRR